MSIVRSGSQGSIQLLSDLATNQRLPQPTLLFHSFVRVTHRTQGDTSVCQFITGYNKGYRWTTKRYKVEIWAGPELRSFCSQGFGVLHPPGMNVSVNTEALWTLSFQFYGIFVTQPWLIKWLAIGDWTQSLATLPFLEVEVRRWGVGSREVESRDRKRGEGGTESSNPLITWLVPLPISTHP